jgi:hypothetical protein
MMQGIATLCMKQHGEYRLSAINDSGEAIINSKYLLEFEAKFESIQISSKGLERSSFLKKQRQESR